MKFSQKVASVMAAAVLASGLSVVSAPAASAANGVTPKCYYTKTVLRDNAISRRIIYNVVAEQYALSYPVGYKMCRVVQTQSLEDKKLWGGWQIRRSTIYNGWIKVRS